MTLAFWLAWAAKSTLVLAAAFLASQALRGSSAAVRNLLWRTALAGMLLLPLFEQVDWRWRKEVTLPGVALESTSRTVIDVVARAGRWPWSPGETLFGVWALGAALFLARTVAAFRQAARLARRSRPWRDGLRINDDISIPMVCGLLRPVILLPSEALSWAADRLEVVLAHESMHIQRNDTRWQALAQAACAFYWPHPLAWRAAAELRKESEQACDDGVLGTGILASAYAGHLVEVARGLRRAVPAPEGAIAMARFHELERRVTALLNPRINRHRAGLRATALAAAGALALLVLMSGVRLTAQGQGGRLAGTVYDASGAVVPSAQVVVTFPTADAKKITPRREFAITNAVGEFSLEPLPEGIYSLTVRKPGFSQTALEGVEVKAVSGNRLKITLNVGRIQETVDVQGTAGMTSRSGPTPSAASGGDAPKRINVGGNVQAANLIEKSRPSYPPECKAEGVEGSVLLRAVIGREGQVINLEPINQLVDPRLVTAAIDAVRQWKYRPTLLNGQPVEVITEVQVNFTLMK
jgi:TonB family protein